jgi:GT2 family glycosyltransferase
VFDNDSTDGTAEWLKDVYPEVFSIQSYRNSGVSHAWNQCLNLAFGLDKADHVLVVNNDTVFPPWFYERLLSYDIPFATGVSVGSMAEIQTKPPVSEPIEAPDFSAFLITKNVWETVGSFDEKMVMYVQDLDYHIRAYRAGIHLWNTQTPFYHARSSTLAQCDPRERRLIEMRADADRAVFATKWGCAACSKDYEAMFTQEMFGVDKKS